MEKFSPKWFIQVLTYDDKEKVEAVFEKLKDFNGQPAGRLIFADYSGVNKDAGGPVAYEEVEVDPSNLLKIADNEKWLKVISNLEKGFVAEPFVLETSGRHVLIRMENITYPGEELLKEKRNLIKNNLARVEMHRLTTELLERLKQKYHLKIDDDLLQSVNLKDELQNDLLGKPVLELDGISMTVGQLIDNMSREKELRKTVTDDYLRNVVVNNFITNNLTDMEALNRHYEENEPFKSVYDFYKKNNLRKFLLAGIKERVVVEEVEIRDYFDKNSLRYTYPKKISYVIIKEDIKLLNEISQAILQGADFFDQALEHSIDAQINTVESGYISDEIADELAKLQIGQTSSPFPVNDGYAILRLVDQAGGGVVPYEQVRNRIEGKIREKKYLESQAVYIEKARAAVDIKVNQRVWNKLKDEYKNAKGI